MSFSMNTSRIWEPRSFGRAIKPADDAVKADVSAETRCGGARRKTTKHRLLP